LIFAHRMNPLIRTALTLAIFYLPALAVFAFMIRARKAHQAAAREPFTEKPLRLPGESTREKADRLFDTANEKMLLVLLGCPVVGWAYTFGPGPKPVILGAILLGVALVGSGWLGVRIRNELKESWNYRLGAKGEQVVGRELDRLMAKGYEVFHDVPCERWNIDHVVVGPRGVFAVETKAWRKPKAEGGKKVEVVFDGSRLIWPGKRQPDCDPIADALRVSNSLQKWIAGEAAESTAVVPVVALPGWSVRIEKFGDVAVYSATDMSEPMLKRGKSQLLPAQIQRIAWQLSKACAIKS
jgi:hypothetical protein